MKLSSHTAVRSGRYFLRRAFAILLTIVIGVFLTIVLANHKGMIDFVVERAVNTEIARLRVNPDFHGDLETERTYLETKEGLNLPFLAKHLRYTYKALFLDWGNIQLSKSSFMPNLGSVNILSSSNLILSKLPNTLLLSGVSYLLLALIGIPLALFLSQREGSWLDKLMGVLTPISSVPSWVLGVVLVIMFAVEIKIFPVGKMYGINPSESVWGSIKDAAYHMVLPVTAIFLSMFFNLVYNWRTYLLIGSDEDFVTLGKAQGLKRTRLEKLYILKPALPYMLTSIVLTFVGFWQTITALEYFFQWPGIGKLYVDSLPNFRGESMFYGEMSVVIGIVVLFAYFLGITLMIMDFCYVLVDPRLRVEPQDQVVNSSLKQSFYQLRQNWYSLRRRNSFRRISLKAKHGKVESTRERIRWWLTIKESFGAISSLLTRAWLEIRREPVAMIGFALAILLVLSSIAVLIFIPYNPVGKNWARSNLTGNPTVAKLALPVWVNWFRRNDLPTTIILDSRKGQAVKRISTDSSGNPHIQIDFTFDYPYQDFPTEIVFYATSTYNQKKPLFSVNWITPDLRVFQLKNASVDHELTYLFSENVPYRKALAANENWQKWFITEGNYQTPGYTILFADPESSVPKALSGSYGVRIDGYLFEENTNLDIQMVVFGQVEGWAGTDNLRRNLLIPLLWGLPFALLIGVIGAISTTLISLLISAMSAWFGGIVDGLFQRVIEANLILPVMAVGVLLYSYYGFNLWLILGLIVLLNILGGPTKTFRPAFLQVKEASYIEAAKAYGASDFRIIFKYLIPRILPVIIPQIVILIPNFFFLEATLAIFNISDNRFPTWGRIIYDALRYGAAYGSRFWVLEPIAMMLITGVSFVLLGFALNRMMNPKLKHV